MCVLNVTSCMNALKSRDEFLYVMCSGCCLHILKPLPVNQTRRTAIIGVIVVRPSRVVSIVN